MVAAEAKWRQGLPCIANDGMYGCGIASSMGRVHTASVQNWACDLNTGSDIPSVRDSWLRQEGPSDSWHLSIMNMAPHGQIHFIFSKEGLNIWPPYPVIGVIPYNTERGIRSARWPLLCSRT